MKTTTVSTLSALLVILAFGILSPLQAQNPEAQFQQGLIKEEGEGSLQEAIDIYTEVAEDESAGRPLQATAMLHIGLCYEKLGRQEAMNTYRNIINIFPDQTETVKVAREKLSLLSQSEAHENAKPRELNIRKIWDGPEALCGETSPDGRYLSYVDWETGDLAIYELATSKEHRLTNKGSWEECYEYAEDSRWSPDGKQIVYSWWNDKMTYELRLIGLNDMEPRVLYHNEEIQYMVPCDWSPDGKQILACMHYQENMKQAVALISLADKSMRVLKTVETWPGKMCFTKDGHYIIYDSQQKDNSSIRDIYLLPVNGGGEIPLVQHPADDFFLGLTKDGESMLFSSDRDGTAAFYLLEMEDGKPKGEPNLVRSGMGEIEVLGFTPEGSFYYGVAQESSDIYTLELDPETGSVITPLAKLNTRFQGNNREPAYSPDGKHMAYISVTQPSAPSVNYVNGTGNVLIIRSTETNEERKIVPETTRMGYPRWSPDGNNILVVEWDEKGFMGYRLINAETGHMQSILSPEEGLRFFGKHEFSPDGATLYYGRHTKNLRNSQIISRDLESGTDKIIYESKEIIHLSLSPDGLRLVILSRPPTKPIFSMFVIPVTGGEANVLFRTKENEKIAFGGFRGFCTWSNDGSKILTSMIDGNEEDPKWELCRISATSGEIERLGITIPGEKFSSLSIHPDGRHISFSTEINPLPPAVWVMENFLPSD